MMSNAQLGPPCKIEQAEQFELTLPNFPTLSIRTVAIPPSTGVSHTLGHDHDDRTISVPNDLGSLWLYVSNIEDGAHVAQATFAATDKSVLCDTIEVERLYRGRGVGTALYDLAEQIFQVESQPSNLKSRDAEVFWAKRLSDRRDD